MRGRHCEHCGKAQVFGGQDGEELFQCGGCGAFQLLREDLNDLARRGGHKCSRCKRRTLRRIHLRQAGLYVCLCWNEDCRAVTFAAVPDEGTAGLPLHGESAFRPVEPSEPVTPLLDEVRL